MPGGGRPHRDGCHTHDDIPFPAARLGSIGGVRWTLADHDLGETKLLPCLRVRPQGIRSAASRPSVRGATLLDLAHRVPDRSPRDDAHLLILGEVEPKAARNLFRALRRRPASVLSMRGGEREKNPGMLPAAISELRRRRTLELLGGLYQVTSASGVRVELDN
jgi:hypothetical protein